jgi:hypothetical protein
LERCTYHKIIVQHASKRFDKNNFYGIEFLRLINEFDNLHLINCSQVNGKLKALTINLCISETNNRSDYARIIVIIIQCSL